MEYCVILLLSTNVTRSDNEGLITLHSFVCLYLCNGNWYLTDFSAIRTTMCTNITDKNIPERKLSVPKVRKVERLLFPFVIPIQVTQ